MGITAYSVIISVLFYNLSLIVVFLLRRSGAIKAKYTSALLLLFTLLGVIRLLTPIDLDGAYVIRSYQLLPAVEDALTAPLLGPFTLGRILLLIWSAGTLVFLLRDVIRQRRYVLENSLLALTENEQISRIAAEFGDKFALKISPEVELPFVTGLFKSEIYVPDIELDDEEWRNIFRHETQHIRARDEWKKLFFRGIRAVFWWNPLVHLSEDDINLLIELQCDDRVAGSENLDVQEGYLHTMVELMKRYIHDDSPVGASRMIGKEKEMKIRFEALLARETKQSRRMRIVMPVLMLALFLASYFVIVQPIRFPKEEEVLISPNGNAAYDFTEEYYSNDSMYIVFVDNEYRLFIDGSEVCVLDEEALSLPSWENIPIYGGEK